MTELLCVAILCALVLGWYTMDYRTRVNISWWAATVILVTFSAVTLYSMVAGRDWAPRFNVDYSSPYSAN